MTATTREETGPEAIPETAPERPLRKDAERNRQRVLQAARELLAERGLALTLNDVAHRAGVGVGTVYRHFPDKDELVDAALAGQLDGLIGLVEEGLALPCAWDGLVHVLTRGMATHVAHRGLRDVALASEKGRHQVAVAVRIFALMETLIERAHAEGSLRPDVTLADITMIHFMVTEFADHSADVAPQAYERYLQLFVEALRVRPGAAELATPLTDDQTHAVASHWIESHRTRSR